MCVCIYENRFAVHLKVTQCCCQLYFKKNLKLKNLGIAYSYLLTNLESNILESNIESKTFQHKAREEILANNISDKKFLLLMYKKTYS